MPRKKTSTYILLALLVFAGTSLLAGLCSGLFRLGLLTDISPHISPLLHGPLMMNSFLGTLISLERAAALERKWAYSAPIVFAAANVTLLSGSLLLAQLLFVIGAIIFLSITIFLYQLQKQDYHFLMILGAASLLTGNLLFFCELPIFDLVSWWISFLLLTIFGERLELNRIMRPSGKARTVFMFLCLLWISGCVLIYVNRPIGWTIASAALVLLALWLFRYDVARRTIKGIAWTRYSAVCLLLGYVWLIIAGFFGIFYNLSFAGPIYDAQLHMIFIGFVFSMIFAHASVIIPSLSGKLIPYHHYFYLPLAFLHISLIMRIIGDVYWLSELRKAGSYMNVIAILLFLAGILVQIIKGIFNKATIHNI